MLWPPMGGCRTLHLWLGRFTSHYWLPFVLMLDLTAHKYANPFLTASFFDEIFVPDKHDNYTQQWPIT